MRNKKMLKVVSLIALATTCIVSGAFAFNTKVANAETEDVFHELGASVRISTDKGMRFAFGLPENKTGDGYEIGTLMIPKEILDGEVLNHNEDESDEVDVDYQEVCCSKTWVPNDTLEGAKDGYKYYNAVLTEIPNWHYNTVVVARSYYKKDGVYTYSEPVERCIGYVASAALNYGEEDEDSNQILTDIVIAGYGETALSVELANDLVTMDEEATLIANNEKGYLPIWSSSNEAVATVDRTGEITAVRGGETTVTATIGNVSAEKKVYVLGDGLYSDQIGMRIGGYQYHDKPAYFNMATGANGEMTITAQFSDSAAYYPMLMLRNMYSKAYYQALVSNGYTKLAFNLAVEGDISDLYVFGKALNTFPENEGIYAIAIDVEHIVTYYDNIYGIATTGGQAGQAGSLDKMLIAWKSPLTWAGSRNYVFTISNAAFMSTPTLDVNANDVEIAYGETATLTATTNWDESFVVWSSSDETIATVENGVVTVTGQNWGEVTITATIAGVSVDTIITVNVPTQLEVEFAVESKDIITVNATTTLEATTDWNVERVVWSSSNNEVATVENGVVTGVKGGEVTITATLGELTASKTIYVVGDGLYSDQIGMRIGGYQYHDKPAYFNMATGENGAMTITAQFSDSAAYYPMLMLRNMYSKAYYEKLIAEGYKKLTFSLAVGGDNASNVSDLYVFGKALPTFAKNASGAYQIVVDVQHIVTYYDNIYGIATTGGQAGQSGSLDKMLIAWKSPLTWSGSRNYVFTISNTGFRKGVLFSDDFGFRDGGVNKTYDGMTVDTGANGEIIIDATFNATATYGSFLMFNKMDTITYLGGLKGKYASFTFELTVEGGAVNDLHTFGTAKAISTCNKVSGKDNTYVVEIRLDMTYFTDSGWKSNMNTFATSTGQAGSWGARSQMLLAWRYSGSSGFVNPGNHAPRNYKFTIANFELRESLLYTY